MKIHRDSQSSTKMNTNFNNKTHGTSETNKSFNHCNLEWGFKIKHTVCRRPKNLTRMKVKLKKLFYDKNIMFERKKNSNIKTLAKLVT